MTLEITAQDPRVHLLSVSDIGPALDRDTFLSRLQNPQDTSPLPGLLDLPDLVSNHVEVFAVEDIKAIGLTSYLHEAYDIPKSALQADAQKLNALEGSVIVLPPCAVGRLPQSVDLPPAFTHIGSYRPEAPDTAPRDMPKPTRAPVSPGPSQTPKSRVPTWLAAVVLLLLFWALAWFL